MIQCKDRYYIFSTGQGILSKSSSDKEFWSSGPSVFTNPPSWTTNAVPGFTGIFWAPDVLFTNNQYYLYYAVSTFGSQVSAIGLVTNPTLDPTDPAYRWTDHGPVIQSTNGSAYNTIDPGVCFDTTGNLWLVFGSYWSGIYVTQLNPLTGLRLSANSPTYQLAYNSSIEASYIYHRGGYYYLFVNWGSCCSGVNSTYNIRVGRSPTITGTYLDRNGVNMVNGGGTLFLRGNGKYTGPGHVGIFQENGHELLTYHYYDANAWAPEYGAYGHADFDLMPLAWTADNWPLATNDWSAVYHFDADAADANGQYTGLLQGNAAIQNDTVHSHVLNLNGATQSAWLPPGVGYAQTFAAVVNWRGGGAWQRIFDFGYDTSRTVMLTPASGDNVLRCDINPGGNLQTLQWNRPLPTNQWTHVAVTLDGNRGVLYVNGAPVATNTSMNLLPVNVAMQTNYLGRSKFSADPFFNGEFASFRIYGRALSPAEIVAPVPRILKPEVGASWSPGNSITIAGGATDFADVPLAPSNLSWRIEYSDDSQTNTVFGPSSGISNAVFVIPPSTTGTGVYTVVLTATDNFGRQSSDRRSLAYSSINTDWGSFFPFTSSGLDASNHNNAALIGGASIQTDPQQGNVLNLSGAGQYANLPATAGSAKTFAGWIKWRGGNAWQRIFDFGRDTQHWFFLTPRAASGMMQLAITPDAATYNQVLESPSAFPLNTWTHVAVVIDGRQGVLYLNGNAVAVNNSVNLLPSDVVPTRAWFGRSQFAADPYLNAQLDSIYLNGAAFSSLEVKQAFLQAELSETYAGGNVTLSWPQWASSMQLYSATQVANPSWNAITNIPTLSNGMLTLTLPATNSSRYFRLQWP